MLSASTGFTVTPFLIVNNTDPNVVTVIAKNKINAWAQLSVGIRFPFCKNTIS